MSEVEHNRNLRIYMDNQVTTCSDEVKTNCFAFVGAGCITEENLAGSTYCNGSDWEARLTFTGTGIEVAGDIGCTHGPATRRCSWILDNDLTQGEFGSGGMAFVATNLSGEPDATHVLSISYDSTPLAEAFLRIESAWVHTGLTTPLHPHDQLWIPGTSEQVRYDGQWETAEGGFRQTREVGAIATIPFIGDRFSTFTQGGDIVSDSIVSVTTGEWRVSTFLDGVKSSFNDQPLSPQYHEVSLSVDQTNGESMFVVRGYKFHPLPNMTTIGDAVLAAPAAAATSPAPPPASSPASTSSSSVISTTTSSSSGASTESATPSNSSQANGADVGAIAGGVVGGVVFLASICIALVLYRRRQQRREQLDVSPGSPEIAATPLDHATPFTLHPVGAFEAHRPNGKRAPSSFPPSPPLPSVYANNISPNRPSYHGTDSTGIVPLRSPVAQSTYLPDYTSDAGSLHPSSGGGERMEQVFRYVDDRINAALQRPDPSRHVNTGEAI